MEFKEVLEIMEDIYNKKMLIMGTALGKAIKNLG